MIHDVRLTRGARKQLVSAPDYIQTKLEIWVRQVHRYGLEEVRKISGFHDEPLKGRRSGQRSIRLNRSWRAIYRVLKEEAVFVLLEEVVNHAY